MDNRVELWWSKHKKWFFIPVFTLGLITFLLLMLQLSSFLLLHFYLAQNSGAQDQRLDLDAYQNHEWAAQYFQEFQEASVFQYTPYTEFQRKPDYQGRYVNLDQNSLRKTTPSCPDKKGKALRIFMFGGSTMWGSGARDEGTIPSQVAKILCQQKIPVEVTNFGESGYVNTQEIIRLQLELRKGNLPDLVIFYDGFNEVYAAFQNQKAGLPQNQGNRIQEFNLAKKFDLQGIMPQFNDLLEQIQIKIRKDTYPPLTETVSTETSRLYVENKRIIEALSEEYNFTPLFYWQPTIFTKETLSSAEQNIVASLSVRESFIQVTKLIQENPHIHDLTQIFNGHPETIYVDWSHISEAGNALVAKSIAQDIQIVMERQS